MEEELRTNKEAIDKLSQQIISNSNDSKWANSMVRELLRLQKQDDDMNKLIDVPLKDVTDTIDLGACAIHKVKDGYVFIAKGGMTTHVSMRMQSVCGMLQAWFEAHGKAGDDITNDAVYSNFASALEFIFQAPIFASLSEKVLFDIATTILKSFNDYTNENYTNAEAVPESEEDIKANVEAENTAKAIDILAESPMPPEDI